MTASYHSVMLQWYDGRTLQTVEVTGATQAAATRSAWRYVAGFSPCSDADTIAERTAWHWVKLDDTTRYLIHEETPVLASQRAIPYR